MKTDVLSEAHKLSDGDLAARVRSLAQQERSATAALVAHLAVFDARRLFLAEGCTSLFAYCTEVLRLAEYAAYNRIEAARAARDIPVLLEMLAAGDLTLATVRLLAPHLRQDTGAELLAAARGKSKREVEELVAELRPKPPVPPSIRMRPLPKDAPAPGPSANGHLDFSGRHAANHVEGNAGSGPPSVRRPAVEPLGGRQFRVQFTASEATRDKLRLAKDLLRHQIPDGDLGAIVDRALTVLLEALAREKFAATDRPRPRGSAGSGAPKVASRHIPAYVRRAVWMRDGGRCAFLGTDGRRCAAREFLEFHHVVPFSAGGASTPDNIELRCGAHNRYEAEVYFGRARIPAISGEPMSPEMHLRDPDSARDRNERCGPHPSGDQIDAQSLGGEDARAGMHDFDPTGDRGNLGDPGATRDPGSFGDSQSPAPSDGAECRTDVRRARAGQG